MAKKKLCKLCHERPAEIPDRYEGVGTPRKEICRECHTERLARDFEALVKRKAK